MSISTINTEELSRGKMQARIVKVISPSLFWIHLAHCKAHFDEFLEDLEIYMERKKDKLRIITPCLELNAVVAVKTKGKWQRGVVVRLNEDDSVQLFLRDWGIFIRHSRSELYRLEKHFLEEEWHAIPCGLANAAPVPQGQWWDQGTKALTKLLMEGHVGWFHIIEPIHAEGAAINLKIVRQRDDSAQDMLETLVQLGHARRTEGLTISEFPTVNAKNVY